MKTDWQTKKLGDICDIKTGKKDVNQGNPDGKYPFFTCAKECTYSNKYSFDTEAILIAGNGDVGNVSYYNGKFEAYQRTYVLSGFKEVLPRFIYLFLDGLLKNTVSKQKLGNTMPYIKLGMLTEFEIPFVPLFKQWRIVKILDEVFEGIKLAKENTEKNLRNSKELSESYLQGILANPGADWEEKTLKEISLEFARGKSKHRPRNDKKLYGGTYPFIQTGDIRNSNHLIKEHSQTYNETGLAQSKLWTRGTICITIAANIAETGILDFDACFPDSVIGLVVDPKKADKSFIEYVLQFFKKKLQAKGKGSAQDNLNMAKFENEYFPIPPLKEQKIIVAKLDALSAETKKLEGIYKQKLADLEELKKSVFRKAFSGEL